MKFLKAFGMFWYEFIIGDDPKIAAAIVVALALLGAAMGSGAFSDHGLTILGAVLIIVAFTITLVLDTRPKKP
jgi:hypothetical protein